MEAKARKAAGWVGMLAIGVGVGLIIGLVTGNAIPGIVIGGALIAIFAVILLVVGASPKPSAGADGTVIVPPVGDGHHNGTDGGSGSHGAFGASDGGGGASGGDGGGASF